MVPGLRRPVGALTPFLLAFVLVSGCATAISGTPRTPAGAGADSRPRSSSSSSAKPSEGTAAGMLGELTTIDPCSLTDTRKLASFGNAEPGVPDSLDDCLIEVKTSAPEPVELYVGGLDRTESWPDINVKPATDRQHGLKVVEYDSDSTYCNHLLVFADGITLSVNAAVYEGEEPKLCDIVQAAMNTVVDVLGGGDVKHRSFARNSLGRVDPCGLVPVTALAAVPGLGSVRPKDYPAQHGCAWTAPDNSVRLRIMFTAGEPPKPTGDGAKEATVAGRASVLSPTPRAGSYVFCAQQTGHIPFRAGGQSGLVEIAAVFVRMKEGQLDAACKAATDVATAVWPKLPKA